MRKKQTAVEPELIIHVNQFGVSKIRIPYTTLAEEEAGRKLQSRCSAIIALLSEVARGTASQIEPLAPAPSPADLIPKDKITYATNQPHHPR